VRRPIENPAAKSKFTPDPVKALDASGKAENYRRIAERYPCNRPWPDMFNIDNMQARRKCDARRDTKPRAGNQQRTEYGAEPSPAVELLPGNRLPGKSLGQRPQNLAEGDERRKD